MDGVFHESTCMRISGKISQILHRHGSRTGRFLCRETMTSVDRYAGSLEQKRQNGQAGNNKRFFFFFFKIPIQNILTLNTHKYGENQHTLS